MVLIVSMLRLGFAERRVEQEQEPNHLLTAARSKSSAVARSFDMEHLRDKSLIRFIQTFMCSDDLPLTGYVAYPIG